MSSSQDLPSAQRIANYRRAGWVYLILGFAILLLTVASPGLLAPERRQDIFRLIIGLPVFIAFAWLIADGRRLFAGLARSLSASPERATAIGWWWQEKLVWVLTLTNSVRFLVFAANGLGTRPRLRDMTLSFEAGEPSWRSLINAALMAVIVFHLARAGFGGRRRDTD